MTSMDARACHVNRKGGFTLAEVSVAMGLAIVISTIAMRGFTTSMHYVRSNGMQVAAHSRGSRALRMMYVDVVQARAVEVKTYYGGSTADYGSYAKITRPDGRVVAYYRYPATPASSGNPSLDDLNKGNIYFDSDASTGSDYRTDKLLLSTVQDFEFRKVGIASYRIGFAVGILGYPTHSVGGKEADLVRLSTSAMPRAPETE